MDKMNKKYNLVFGVIIIIFLMVSSVQALTTIDVDGVNYISENHLQCKNEQQLIGKQQKSLIGIGVIICKTGEQQLPGYGIAAVRAKLKLRSTDGTVNRVIYQVGYLEAIYANDNYIGTYLVRTFYFLPLDKKYSVKATWKGVTISKTADLSSIQHKATIEFLFESSA